MSEYFPKPRPFGGSMKVELDLSNYATKSDHNLLKRMILANLKSDVNK